MNINFSRKWLHDRRISLYRRYASSLYLEFCVDTQLVAIDDLRISHNASGMGANIRVLVT